MSVPMVYLYSMAQQSLAIITHHLFNSPQLRRNTHALGISFFVFVVPQRVE